MPRRFAFIGLIAFAGCNGSPPVPTPSAATVPGERDGRAYTLFVPNMT